MQVQYPDGLVGPLIILPATPWHTVRNVTDDWAVVIADFYSMSTHDLVAEYYLTPASGGSEPIPDAIMVNGAFSSSLVKVISRNSTTRLRFIAANTFSMFTVSIDGVTMKVIEVDATEVLPYEVDHFVLNVAQRVSVLVDWSKLPANVSAVWLRVTAMASMYPVNISGFIPPYEVNTIGVQPLNPAWVGTISFNPNVSAVAYDPTVPNAAGRPVTPAPAHPNPDNNLLDARPEVPLAMPAPTHSLLLEIEFWVNSNGVNIAGFNNISSPHAMNALPTLLKLMQPQLFGSPLDAAAAVSASSYPMNGATPGRTPALPGVHYNSAGQYLLPYGAVVEVTIVNTDTGEHPIHTYVYFPTIPL